MDTGSLAALVMDAMHCVMAVCRVSHSLPLLHLKRWSPYGSISSPQMHEVGMAT